jgi:hypothetical protein
MPPTTSLLCLALPRYSCRNRRQSCRVGALRPARAARDQQGHRVRHRWTIGRTLAHAAALAAARISAPNRHSGTANLLVTVSTQSRNPNREPTRDQAARRASPRTQTLGITERQPPGCRGFDRLVPVLATGIGDHGKHAIPQPECTEVHYRNPATVSSKVAAH